jgi:hypothetical protein
MTRAFLLLLIAVVCFAQHNPDVVVTVDPGKVTHTPNPLHLGCHSDSGYTHQPRGFYSQLIIGESFESVPPAESDATVPVNAAVDSAVPLGYFTMKSKKDSVSIRHCSFQLHACNGGEDADFVFNIVAALNGEKGAVSFQSSNYKTKYITSTGVDQAGVPTAEKSRLGVVEPGKDKDAASFAVVPGLSDAKAFSFQSLSAAFKGQYISTNGLHTGSCKYESPSSDAVLVSSDTVLAAAATWDVTKAPPPPPAPAPYFPWQVVNSSTANGSATIDGDAFHGMKSLKIEYLSGTGFIGMNNRGLGREGLVFYAGKEYEGYLFAKSDSPVNVTVLLQATSSADGGALASPSILASASFTVNGNWSQNHFKFTPSAATTCVNGTSDPDVHCGGQGHSNVPGHICVKCGGEFVVALSSPGTVSIDYVFMQPGSWGRINDLPVLKSGTDLLRSMGVTTIRQGGSFTDPATYFWKLWRGKPW